MITSGFLLLLWGLWLVLESRRISTLYTCSLEDRPLPDGEQYPLIASQAGCVLIGFLLGWAGLWGLTARLMRW
jgi:uncharacterized membrane protein YccC